MAGVRAPAPAHALGPPPYTVCVCAPLGVVLRGIRQLARRERITFTFNTMACITSSIRITAPKATLAKARVSAKFSRAPPSAWPR